MGRVQLPNYPVPGEALSVAQLQKKVRLSWAAACWQPPSIWRCNVCCQAGPAGLARLCQPPASTLGSREREKAHVSRCEHAAAAATAAVLQVKSQDTERRKGIPWTEEEHRCAAAAAAARCPCKPSASAAELLASATAMACSRSAPVLRLCLVVRALCSRSAIPLRAVA